MDTSNGGTSRMTTDDTGDLIARSARLLDDLREHAPLVQNITNAVATNLTANVLLAIGASPAMVDIPTEADQFARIASGVLINLGTPHEEARKAMPGAAVAAREASTPWVLDPVAVGSLPVRTSLARELVALRPTIVRGNASEILSLAGLGEGGRGVESTDSSEGALDGALALARTHGAVVAVSGATDVVTDGQRVVRLQNGHPLLTKVTGAGCALGAVMAAFASLEEDALVAAVSASAAYTIAAELAAEKASGPGSFAEAFLDELANIDADTLRARMDVG